MRIPSYTQRLKLDEFRTFMACGIVANLILPKSRSVVFLELHTAHSGASSLISDPKLDGGDIEQGINIEHHFEI